MRCAGEAEIPPHVRPSVDSLPGDLTESERLQAIDLICGYAHIFSKDEFDLGRTHLITHNIDTGNAKPIRQSLRRHPLSHLSIIDEHVNDLLKKGLIEKCSSDWCSNVVLARRKSANGKALDKSG